MIPIAHRGNINGPDPNNENKPESIVHSILLGFHCEVDLWIKDQDLYLGHDFPQYVVSTEFLFNLRNSLWIHAKNSEALIWLTSQYFEDKNTFNFFWHQTDSHTLTSWGYIWSYPGYQIKGPKCVYVMPENDITTDNYSYDYICTDYPKDLGTI